MNLVKSVWILCFASRPEACNGTELSSLVKCSKCVHIEWRYYHSHDKLIKKSECLVINVIIFRKKENKHVRKEENSINLLSNWHMICRFYNIISSILSPMTFKANSLCHKRATIYPPNSSVREPFIWSNNGLHVFTVYKWIAVSQIR